MPSYVGRRYLGGHLMTKEEEIRANVAVATIQNSWEMMANRAIELGCMVEMQKLKIVELEGEIAALKKVASGEA